MEAVDARTQHRPSVVAQKGKPAIKSIATSTNAAVIREKYAAFITISGST
jgi:hypothetical protein